MKTRWIFMLRWFIPSVILISACSAVATNTPTLPTELPVVETQPGQAIITGTPAMVTPAGSQPTSPLPAPPQETPAPLPTGVPALTPMREVSVQVFPDAALYQWQPVIADLSKPLGLAHAADGSGRLFVVEQTGRIWIFQDGQLSKQPFLDIRRRVGSTGFEQGLLGLTFHPGYAQNGYFYINYTDTQGDTLIARFQVSPANANQADADSELQLLAVNQPYQNHNGGMIAFGPDGYLYAGLGDGGSANDPRGFGQSLVTHLGKILRLDVNGAQPYAIPSDNPFAAGGGLPEIWAYGLRNPWRFAFDRLTGDLYIADVGQNQWEEINFVPAGAPGGLNFGWKLFEGSRPFEGSPPQGAALIFPVAEYSHAEGCSVTGGVVYRGQRLPEWQGIYLYGDYCTGRVWGLLRDVQGAWQNRALFEGMGQITAFGEDEAGEIYLVDQNGTIFMLIGR